MLMLAFASVRLEDTPSFHNFGVGETPGRILYAEVGS